MIERIFELLALKFLLLQRWRSLKNVKQPDTPIQLIKRYEERYAKNTDQIYQLVKSITNSKSDDLKHFDLIETDEYKEFKNQINAKLKIFNNKPYQCGSLDLEIDIVSTALCQFKKPDVLEIGVSNGYSSAFLYKCLSQIGGTITSIDFPRFSTSLCRPTDRVREWLAIRGKIKNTGTLGDFNPGGIIPMEKYAGWLIPMNLRTSVRNTTLYGDAFIILNELQETKFDLVVLDAMKGYKDRIKIMYMILERLRPNGICFVDGYWVNSAFHDFCKGNRLQSWNAGRVGVFCNRPSA